VQVQQVAVVCTLFFAVYLGNSLCLSLFPNYLLRLGLGSVSIGIALMVYSASQSFTFLPSGRLSDRLGRRPLVISGSLLLALSALSLSLSNRIETTVLALVGQGIGLGLLVPSGNALMSDLVLRRGSGLVFAVYQIATLASAAVGSFAAGALAETAGFQNIFALSAVLFGATAVFGYAMVPRIHTRSRSDYGSAVAHSLRSSMTGTVSILRSNRELALLTGALVIHSLGFSMINPFIPLFAEEGIHLDIAQVGILVAVWNVGLTIAQIPSGHLTDRFGARPLLLSHFVLSSLSWALYVLSSNFEIGLATMLFFGIVGALDMPARRSIMIEYATPEAGKATIIGSIDAITGTVGIAGPVIGGLAWSHFGYVVPFQVAAFVNAFACIPLIAIVRRRSRVSASTSKTT
jgi:MFS family permease